MKTKEIALFLGLGLVPLAHADVSDSGNLSIGGYAAIGGTMTVAGGLAVSGPSTATYFYGDGSGLTNLPVAGDATLAGPNAFTGDDTRAGSLTMLAGSTITAALGASCAGLGCRVGYSSGTANSFSFVLASSTTYVLYYNIKVASGTTTAAEPLGCRINGDATAGNYGSNGVAYPNAYNYHTDGAVAFWVMKNCGTGAVNAGDFVDGTWKISTVWGQSRRLSYAGGRYDTCQSQTFTASNTFQEAGVYRSSQDSFTISCGATVSALGIEYEAILYQVGK